ncbi:MAG: hypothetical protein ACREN4_00755, partial [Candidatus Dormibacteria bacterium]
MKPSRIRRSLLGGLGKGAAFTAVLGLLGLAGAMTAQVVGAWSYSVLTSTYTSSSVPTAAAPGTASGTAQPGQYIDDSATVDDPSDQYVQTGFVTFALYQGTPGAPPSCSSLGTPLQSSSDVPVTQTATGTTTEKVYSASATSGGYLQIPSTATSGEVYCWVATYTDTSESNKTFTELPEVVTVNVPPPPLGISTSVQGLPITLQQSTVTNPNAVYDIITLSGATSASSTTVTVSVTLKALPGVGQSSSVNKTFNVILTLTDQNGTWVWVGDTPNFVPEAAGQFCYSVNYNNGQVVSTCGQETFTVNKYNASLTTYPVTPVTTAAGMVLSDLAVMDIYPNHQAQGGSGQYGAVTFT